MKEYTSRTSIEVQVSSAFFLHISRAPLRTPYNKTSQHPTVNYDNTKITATGDLNATVVGNYRIVYSINDKLTYTWTDGTQEDKYIDWSIVKYKATIPTLGGPYQYNKQSQSVQISGYDSKWMSQTGDTTGIEVNDYYITWSLLDTVNTEWSDSTVSNITKSWSIIKREVSIPTITGSFVYDKSVHNASISGYDNNWMTQTGIISETNSGDYTVTWDLIDKENSYWTGGTVSPKSGTWSIAVRKLTIPNVIGTYTYNGGSQEAQIDGFDENYESKSGDLSGTNVGDYRIVFSLLDNENTAWSDDSIVDKYGDWSIAKLALTIPGVSGSYTYNGSEQTVTKTNFNTTYEEVVGDKATDAGAHTAIFTLKDTANTQWSDGSVEPQSKGWSISQAVLSNPSQKNTPTYSGSSITPEWNNYDSTKMSISGTTTSVNAGTFNVTFTITNDNYKFSGGNTYATTWKINKASGVLTLNGKASNASLGTIASGGSSTVTVASHNNANVTFTTTASTNYLKLTHAGDNSTVTLTHGDNTGSSDRSVSVTVKCAADTNYNEITRTISATMQKTSSCVAGDTLIMMGDGTEKMISELKRGDSIMTYNMDTGKFEPQIASIFWDESNIPVPSCLHLTFDNGKVVKLISSHGFFDKTLNTYVYIDYDNFNDYIGHEFVAYSEEGCKLTKLIKAEMVEGIETQYSIESSYNDNFITEGILSITQEPCKGRFEYFKFDDNEVKWDAKDKQENIDKYGLYTWEEWKEIIPDKEMFYAWNGPYFKILMDKGVVTMDDIYYMLEDASHGL